MSREPHQIERAEEGGRRVRQHESGLIVDVTRPDALLDAMDHVLTDRDLYARLQQRALASAADNRWEKILEDFWRGPTNGNGSGGGNHRGNGHALGDLITVDMT